MIDQIRGAVARGWCSKENEHKEMDSELAEAISQEILKLFEAKLKSDNSDSVKYPSELEFLDMCASLDIVYPKAKLLYDNLSK